MKKKKALFIGILALFLFAVTAEAAVVILDDATQAGIVDKLNFSGATVTVNGKQANIDPVTNITRTIQKSAPEHIINDGSSVFVLSTSSVPALQNDNAIPSIVWQDNQTTPVTAQFRVPADFVSGGSVSFRVVADQSDATTACKIDFNVRVNRSGTAWDSAATDQSPATLTATAGIMQVITLSVATDFSSIAAGDLVALQYWRDNSGTDTGDLESYLAEMVYDSQQ